MAGKWSEDITIKFVGEYVAHECLWNTKHPLNKNKIARLSAYRDIANKMNLPNIGEREIVVKIKNIRSTYCQEFKKIKESKLSGSGDYVPSLKWFYILDPIMRKDDGLENTDDNVGNTSFQNDSYNGGTVSQNNIEEPAENTLTEIEQPRTLKKRRLQELESLLTKVKEVCALNNAPPLEEHEFDIFGRSVAAQLKMLPLEKALQAQHYIQSYLTELRLQNSPSPEASLPYYVKFEQMSPSEG
ncbi:hypothetical protein PYW08_009275 [Mythimna loreyi]|uniref:Uncharacterized protein n=1 Tax=Mythimna loreyi TaxID=667449 RepID=A0ACC2Q9C1_9NEOP|nr:hypothetical protein PYW08_009275 [Mythimna loreyi]